MLRKMVKHHGGGTVMLARKESEKVLDIIASAFLCHSKGYLLTAAHSINLTDELFFLPPLPFQQFNPSELKDFQAVPVSVAQYDATNDVALLRVTTSATVTVPNKMFGADEQAEVGAALVTWATRTLVQGNMR